ncbi:MAG: DUF5371 family protein [Candidatus Methanoperedens sp.]|jgi:hypothetical protein|nr:DUF5371 family protein [Candidatus Methanoperedens sp.]CAG1000347.1 hypothetical protein METP1_02841 [Methanosarcinales archaeon]
MTKIVHVQTVLMENELAALKQKTNEESTKDAVAAAIYHYLECAYTHEDAWAKRLEKIMQKRQNILENN